MKKRLLSAALALAMVLTLMPLTVFAAEPASDLSGVTDGSLDATYVEKDSTTLGNYAITDAPGWYAQVKGTDDDANKTRYVKITEGFVINSKYYAGTALPMTKDRDGNDTTTPVSTTFISIGSNQTANLQESTSVNADIYDGKLTLTGGKLTSITVNDSKYTSEGKTTKNEVVLPSTTWSPDATKTISLTLTNVKSSSGVTVTATTDGNVNRTISLNNAKMGAITLNGISGTDTTKLSAQSVTATNGSETGAITIVGSSSSKVEFTDSSTGDSPADITFTAPGGSVQIGGESKTGKITVSSGATEEKAVTVPTVSVTGGEVGGIERAEKASDKSTSASTFTIGKDAVISGEIKTHNGSVTVTSGKTEDISVVNGSVTVNGPTAVVGDVTLGEDGKGTVSFKVTDTGNNVGTVTNDAGTLTVDIPADPKNTFVELTDDDKEYTGHGVKGGTYTKAVPAGWLANSGNTALYYQLESSGGDSYTYYTQAQLGDALTAQSEGEITIVGQESPTQTISFMNGNQPWGSVKVLPNSKIVLPGKVNGIDVSSWTDGTYTALPGVEYPTPATGSSATLNAQSTTNDVTKLTSVKADSTDDIKAVLNGNVITLSGAVKNATGTISIKLVTDILKKDNTYLEEPISITYKTNPGSATFANPGSTGLSAGMTLQDNFTVLRLSNGTTYTVNGSGLKLVADNIKVDGVDAGEGTAGVSKIVATVNISGYSLEQSKTLIGKIQGGSAKFEWGDSTAMGQAINAALASISTSQVDSWRTDAQRAAWQAKNSGTPTTEQMANTEFTDVVLVPYLAVNVTAYNANGTMTATLTPSYRVVVKNPSAGSYVDVFKGKTTGDADGNYIAKAGTSLGTLSTEFGKVTVTFNTLGDNLKDAYMHQDGKYVYKGAENAFEITHAGTTGLGTMTFSKTDDAVVTLTHKVGAIGSDGKKIEGDGAENEVLTYVTLQAAVDDTLPQASDELMDVINVTSSYTGNGTISVTGLARKFKIITVGNTTISSNANADVVDVTANGHTYTIQLLKSNVTTATISVGIAAGGAAIATTSSAKPGDTVSGTIKPSTGYKAGTFTATAKKKDGTSVSVGVSVNTTSNTFSFVVPADATSVTVTPSFVVDTGLPFTDVATTDSYFMAVKWNYDNNYVKGTTTTTFGPTGNVTRAQVVTILYRNAGSPTVDVSTNPYTDINVAGVDAEMQRAIIWATQKNIVQGYGNGKFGPNNPVRKQEFAKILYTYNQYRGRVSTVPTVNLDTLFTDASNISDWAVPYVKWAVGNGVMSAVTGKQFLPQLQLQRWQVAVDVYNYGLRFGA